MKGFEKNQGYMEWDLKWFVLAECSTRQGKSQKEHRERRREGIWWKRFMFQTQIINSSKKKERSIYRGKRMEKGGLDYPWKPEILEA